MRSLQGVVRVALLSPGTFTTVGVLTTTYSVILPFVHDNNNLSSLFRDHWKEVSDGRLDKHASPPRSGMAALWTLLAPSLRSCVV